MMGYYYSDDPGADFERWERDRERWHQQILEDETEDAEQWED